jgi:hypothetical protein
MDVGFSAAERRAAIEFSANPRADTASQKLMIGERCARL